MKRIALFNHGKGLSQGDHLSPLLFNLVVDVFIIILMKVARKNYNSNFMTSVYLEVVLDDTMLFLKHDLVSVDHLKWIMVYFE
jgi:hypothetical protein